jgi:hypothetical protein
MYKPTNCHSCHKDSIVVVRTPSRCQNMNNIRIKVPKYNCCGDNPREFKVRVPDVEEKKFLDIPQGFQDTKDDSFCCVVYLENKKCMVTHPRNHLNLYVSCTQTLSKKECPTYRQQITVVYS